MYLKHKHILIHIYGENKNYICPFFQTNYSKEQSNRKRCHQCIVNLIKYYTMTSDDFLTVPGEHICEFII